MADDTRPFPRLVACHHCGTPVRRREAQAITIEPDGEIRLWTPERAAYYQRYGRAYAYAPVWASLCQACTHDLFPGALAPDAPSRDETAL